MREFKAENGEIVGKIVDDKLEVIDSSKLCEVLFKEWTNVQVQAINKIQSLEKNIVALKEVIKQNL